MQDPRLPAPDIDETEAGSIDLRGISRVLLRHKWSILCLTALICVIAALLVYRQTPIYQATATILIERFPVSYGPIQDPYIAFTEHYLYYETQYGLIKRRAIGERVVDDLGLYQPRDPDAPPPAAHSGFSWKSIFPDDWFPPPQPPTERQRYEGAVSSIVGGISVSPRNRSQLVDIRYQSADPLRAAEIANAVAEAFIEDGLEGRLQMTEQASSYLTERLSELRLKLEASESALQDFLDREQLLDVEGVDSLAGQELTLATEKLSSSRERRRDIESTFRAVQAASTGGDRDLATIPGIADQPEVRQLNQAKVAAARSVRELSTRYGPLHPRMVEANNELDSANEALDRQLQIAVETITGRYRTAVADERLAEDELDQTKDRFREIDRKEFRLEGLQREVDTNRQIFEKFQTQYKETDAAGGVRTANARIIEPARVPGGPIKPNKKRSIMLAFFMGLALSIGLAFLLEHLDNTLKGADDTEQKLGLPVLGLLPSLKTQDKKDLSPLRQFMAEPKSAFAEAIRTIRTGVLLSSLDDEHKVVLVTSSVPGEGKTTLSMNLARALSEMKRVLLIDADMRRPMVAKALDGDAQKGLSHFISGESDLKECLQKASDALYVMPAGVVPPNPLELLSSARFASALDKLGDHYDHIVIDCAPTLAVSDAMVLSKLASSVIYVVRADATPTQAAQAGIKRLRRVGAHVIGAVVNRAVRKHRPYYGKYSNYYGDSYYSDYGYVPEDRANRA